MYFMFECCRCKSRIRYGAIHSYSRNSSRQFNLCKHFSNVQFSYETKYGFFTLGWRIKIYNIYVRCGGNCKRWRRFSDQTFHRNYTHFNDYIECCDNVVVFSAHDDGYYYNGNGFEIQQEIIRKKKEMLRNKKLLREKLRKEREEKLRKEKEEKLRREREEKLRREREEKLRREREEKLRREREEKLRRETEEKKRREIEERNRIMKEQEEENENLDCIINYDTSWIENETMELNTKAEISISESIIYTAKNQIEENYKYTMKKTK